MNREEGPVSLREGFLTLAYLDLTALRNRLRLLFLKPRRLLPWALFLAWMAFVVYQRISQANVHQRAQFPAQLAPILLVLVPGLYIGVLGLIVRGAVSRAPASLSTPADGRFLLGSALPPRLVVTWLLVRQAFSLIKGALINVVIWSVLFFDTPGVRVTSILVGALAVLLAFILTYGLRLPAFMLSRRRPVLVSTVGSLIACLGFGTTVYQAYRAATSGHAIYLATAWPSVQLPLGQTVAQAVTGNLPALLVLFLLAVLAGWLTSATGRDCYPEIWQASSRLFLIRSLSRSGRTAQAAEARMNLRRMEAAGRRKGPASASSSSGDSVPAGALTLAWKEWLTLRRAPSGLRGMLLWLVMAAVAGGIAGRLTQNMGPYAFGVIAGMAVYPALILSTMAGLSLAADLRRPIWWLSDASLTARLMIWTLATSLRVTVLILVGLITAGIVAHTLASALWTIPAVVALVWLLRAIGLSVYSLLPAARDMRGPGNLLRLLLTVILLVPAGGVGAAVGTALSSLPLGLLFGSITAGFEAWGLVAFSAERLRGNGMAIVREELR